MGLVLPTNQASLLLTWFNSFVGYDAIKNRINRVEVKLNSAFGLSDSILRRYQFHTAYTKLLARKTVGRPPVVEDFATHDTLSFLAALKTLSQPLTDHEKARLRARVLEGLSPDRDVRELQHELRAFVHYKSAGCKVSWCDNEKQHFDFLIEGPNGVFEVECKTFADNIGNAISTDLSVAVFEELRRAIDRNGFPESATYEIFVDSAPCPRPSAFGSAANIFFNAAGNKSYDGFHVVHQRRHDFDEHFRSEKDTSWIRREFSKWQNRTNNHSMVAASPKTRRAVFISISGSRTPRPYNAICDSLKRASNQFSKGRPAVIWGHFLGLDETALERLLVRNFGERNALDFFGEYLFKSENRNHVARLRLSADGDIRIGAKHREKIAYGGGPCYDLTSKASRFDSKLVDES